METLSTDILIIGAGPAGLTAALYAARAGKNVLVLEGERAASRLNIGYEIENYPGFPSIDSRELLGRIRGQAEALGAKFAAGDVIALSLKTSPKYASTSKAMIEAKAVILATGRPLAKEKQVPGEERLLGYGVSYCAVCDGPLYKGRDVAAYGRSAEAGEDVLALEQMGVRVHWVTGRTKDPEALRAAVAAAVAKGIDVHFQAELREISGARMVERVVLETEAGPRDLEVSAVFLFREVPTGPLFAKAGLELDHRQCLGVDRRQRTNLDGVYAAGDVTCGGLQIVSAAGEGCVAALQALAFLRK